MNSNGYIMLDFSMLDFSKHNQIIDGIYQRVFEVVGVNKFVIILGANDKTPLPACVSFTNGTYVIESFLFNFAITIDDNVRIEKVSADIIKDGIISAGTTWSSSKIKNELDAVGGSDLINLYSNDTPINNINGQIDMNDNVNNYDILFIELFCSSTVSAINRRIIPVIVLRTNNEYFNTPYVRTNTTAVGCFQMRFISNLSTFFITSFNDTYCYVRNVYGVRLFN